MNEFLELVRAAAAVGWVCLCAVVAISLGMAVFDRPRKAREAKVVDPAEVPPQESKRAA